MSSPPKSVISVCLAGHISSLTLDIGVVSSSLHNITLQILIDEINKEHGLWCSCSGFSVSVSQVYLTSRTSDLRTHQALKHFCPDDRFDEKILDDVALQRQLCRDGVSTLIVGTNSSSATLPNTGTVSTVSGSLKRPLEDSAIALPPSQRATSGFKIVFRGGSRIVRNSAISISKNKRPSAFERIPFEPGTFTFDRSLTLAHIDQLRQSLPARFSYHHHERAARNFWVSMVIAFYDTSHASLYSESFANMEVGAKNIRHSEHLVFELALFSLQVTERSDFERTFNGKIKECLIEFVAKYRSFLYPGLDNNSEQPSPLVNDDLETSFDNIMVLAQASGKPILFVTTDYDMAGNNAWYNRICLEQSVTPYQVASTMSRFFSRVDMWFNKGLIDMILCVGEYGSFAQAISDTLALHDLSLDPEFNTTCGVTKREALLMIRLAYHDVKTRTIDENHDRFKELIDMAGEYRNSPDPQFTGELLLRHDFFYLFFDAAYELRDKNVSLKHVRPPYTWRHSTITSEAVSIVAHLSSRDIRENVRRALLFPAVEEKSIKCDVMRDRLAYLHVPTLPVEVSGLQPPSKPSDVALPKLLFALGMLTMDLKHPLRLRIPNNVMVEEVGALIHPKDKAQQFSGAGWIKTNVEDFFQSLDVRHILDTKEHTLQTAMILLINQGLKNNGKAVIEELELKETSSTGSTKKFTYRYADLFIPGTLDVIELKNASVGDIYRGTFGLNLQPKNCVLQDFRKRLRKMAIRRDDLPVPPPPPAEFHKEQDRGIKKPYEYKKLTDKLTWHDLRVAFRYKSEKGQYLEGIKHLDQLWRDGRYQALLYQNIITGDGGAVSDLRVSRRDSRKDRRFVKAYVVILIAAEVVFVDTLVPKLSNWTYTVRPGYHKTL
ncbi:hypothetical protein IW261DRAFT_1606659 [Armillaria novae-zelandiae]|uniref:AAA-ATPase-like domain-containing protein n=1 Tax=Armillaria novae-zelandiae TaxID=153914 RepID=A0AA39PBT7_9AGAR|nr:hypothetical protein IW261DRAFT_1606659 [Armillaria novae-zelandiae]